MNSIRYNLSGLWRSLQLVVVACVCAFVLFSNVAPAYSLPNPFAPSNAAEPASPTKGEDQLLGIEEGAQKSAIRQQDLLSGEEVIEKSNEGINEVQGAADADKMKRSGNSEAQTVEEIIKDKLEDITGQ